MYEIWDEPSSTHIEDHKPRTSDLPVHPSTCLSSCLVTGNRSRSAASEWMRSTSDILKSRITLLTQAEGIWPLQHVELQCPAHKEADQTRVYNLFDEHVSNTLINEKRVTLRVECLTNYRRVKNPQKAAEVWFQLSAHQEPCCINQTHFTLLD